MNLHNQGLSRVKRLHFVGIGGMGMSGIAEVMHNLGYQVRGSDVVANANIRRLRDLGIEVHIGHAAENLDDAQVLVASSAVKDDNVEMEEARRRFVPVVPRPRMLAELMRLKSSVAVAGTHGKTTTTSMIATLLDAAGFDPTIINGGIINAYDTNGRLGAGEWMVVEADESDGSLARMQATVAVVTNIDPEHLDHYKDFDSLRDAFAAFVENIPFYGLAVLCVDHPEVQAMLAQLHDRRLMTYGFSPQADVWARKLQGDKDEGDGRPRHEIFLRERQSGESRTIGVLKPPMIGAHNMSNALAAIAVATQLGVEDDLILRTLAEFSGVRRRFTRAGEWNGIAIHDDYAHHPVEIQATLEAAREVCKGRLVAVVQPHRYSRLRDLFSSFLLCFAAADVVIAAPVYGAGEAPIEGFDHHGLVSGLMEGGHRDARAIDGEEELAPLLARLGEPGDMVVVMGAGSSSLWANALPERLRALQTRGGEAPGP